MFKNHKLLFYNGKVITMDNANHIYDSVYVEKGIIKDVGEYKILKKKYQDAEEIDLCHKVLMPGFIEPHAHFDLCAIFSEMKNISSIEFKTKDKVLKQLKKVIKETPKGKWIMCFGLDYLINPDLPEMNKEYLDSLTKDHPLTLVIQSMHTIYCNSLALERAGITKETKDTRDGHLIRDINGEPNGILTEQGFLIPFLKLWMKDLSADPRKLLEEESIRWRNLGVTSTWVAGYFPVFKDHFNLMREFFNDKNTPLRGDYSFSFNSIESGLMSDQDLNMPGTTKTRLTGIKFWYDGSPYTGNMFMSKNYLDNDIMQNKLFIPKKQAGERLFEKDFFYKMLKKYHDLGYQLSIHAQGDKACEEVLDMMERILKESPRKDHRHRLEHCAFISKKDLKRASDLGMSVSFHTNHLYYYGEALRDVVVGEEVLKGLLPCSSALKYGMKISLHSDAPMYSPNPLRVAGGAVTRKTRDGLIINKEEALSVTEALRGITIDAAWQMFREKEIGSIEVGKFADFTLIDEDPYEVDPDHIKDIKVITTYLSGIDTKTMSFKK